MCLVDNKRFRFTFKPIPIKKVIIRTELVENGTPKYKAPCTFTFVYRKSGLRRLLVTLIVTLWECAQLDFSISPFRYPKYFFRNLKESTKSNLKAFSLFPKYKQNLEFNDAYKEEYVFEFGFFHAFQTTSEQQIQIFIESLMHIYKFNKEKFVVVDGYIPAFTRYGIGKDGDICARRMMLNLPN